jgi:CCR4-NOT transcription complex subunit 3
LAAKELKKRAWRFHKYYLTWFQRAKNPEEMADDYEKGSYTYFDWGQSYLSQITPSFFVCFGLIILSSLQDH